MNLNNTTKSTEELKNEVLKDVKKIQDDIDEIKTRMTPGQIIDDAIYYRRGGETPAQTFEYLKNNPVGTTFLTLGTLLLMEDADHHSFEATAKEKVHEIKDKVTGAVSSAKEKVGEVTGAIKSKLHGGKDQDFNEESDVRFSADVSDNIGEKVDELKSTAREGMSAAKEKTKEGLESAKARVQDLYQSASTKVRNLDPLTYLALGAGLGTLTGAAIPISEVELSFVDEKLKQRIVDFQHDLEKALNESANILKNEFIGSVTNINLNIF